MKETNILIFGDSIVYGAYDNEKAGWVNRLRILLEEEKDTYYNIFNLGIPGNTTVDVIKRLKHECDIRCIGNSENIIIFAVGINDSQIYNRKNNVQIETFKINIKNLVTMSKKYSNKILFIGLTNVDESRTIPITWNDNINYFNKKIIEFDKVLEETCKEQNVEYLKMFDLLEIDDLEDGLHPNSNGHEKICNKVFNKLQNINKLGGLYGASSK